VDLHDETFLGPDFLLEINSIRRSGFHKIVGWDSRIRDFDSKVMYFSPTTRREAPDVWKRDFCIEDVLAPLTVRLALNWAFLMGADTRMKALIAMVGIKQKNAHLLLRRR
jgi:hypothetical protein